MKNPLLGSSKSDDGSLREFYEEPILAAESTSSPPHSSLSSKQSPTSLSQQHKHQQPRRTYASIVDSTLTERSRSPVEMEPFWVPPLDDEPSPRDASSSSDKPYHIISVPTTPKPKFPWRSPGPFVVYDYILSALLVYIAVGLVQPSLETVSWRALIGAALFQASLIAAVMALYIVMSTCGRRCLQWQDALIAISFGVSIYLTESSSKPWTLPLLAQRTSWELFVGTGLLEAVFIHLMARGLFLLPNKDDAIIMLKREMTSLEQSIALGLAEQYYEEFVCRAGRAVQSARDGMLPVTYSPTTTSRTTNSNNVTVEDVNAACDFRTDPMDVPCIVLAMPRAVDWHQDRFVRELKQSYQSAGMLLPCRISPGPTWLSVTGIKQGYIVDVAPSPLQLMMDCIRRDLHCASDQDKTSQYHREVRRFSHRVAWLAKMDGLENYIKIVEFDRDVMTRLAMSCPALCGNLATGKSENSLLYPSG